tara:strand:+ start:16 stop:315 length:300 start_codon:yes stop_codon:yes gene_type:complete
MSYVIITLLALLNVGLIWYIRSILNKFVFLSENIDDLFYDLNSFSQHLESLYQLETYYGDATLEALISHSRSVVEDVNKFKDVYSLEEVEENDGEEEEE